MAIRDAAALMGHTPNTHQNYYGRWTDEAGLKEAVARLTPASEHLGASSVNIGHP